MRSRVPSGLRVAFLADQEHQHSLPSKAQWADVRFFDTSHSWARGAAKAAAFRPDVTFMVFDEGFDAVAAATIPGTRVGMVVRPPFGASGPWALSDWRKAVDLVTWYEPPPSGHGTPMAIVPLPIDRSTLKAPDFSKRRIAVPRWAAPPSEILERLSKMEELVLLEPQGRLSTHLELLDTAGVFITTTYDAIGRLDPLPVHALARGLLVISTTAFAPLWGIEAEDEYLVRPEHGLLAAVDEFRRIPETSRTVRLRAFQKCAEFFDANEVFQRLTVDVLLTVDARRLVVNEGRLRSVT